LAAGDVFGVRIFFGPRSGPNGSGSYNGVASDGSKKDATWQKEGTNFGVQKQPGSKNGGPFNGCNPLSSSISL